jgi:hypothetical protein
MSRSSVVAAAAAVAVSLMAGSAQAALIDRGGGMVYDDVQDITWLKDWSAGGSDLSWDAANNWANGLSHGGYDDWRLPSALNADSSGPCGGYNCSASEMGYMFYNYFGGNAGESVLNQTGDSAQEMANLGLFTNVSDRFYWTGTALNDDNAWMFATYDGSQSTPSRHLEFRAVAVRDGDVDLDVGSPTHVPEPETWALMLAGLGATGVMARRRRSRT